MQDRCRVCLGPAWVWASTADFFAPDLQGSELAPYVGAGNPAGYISEVTYGRQFYLVFESTSSTSDLQSAIEAVYNSGVTNVDGSLKTEYQTTQSQTHIRAYAIGGASDGALDVALAASSDDFSSGGLFAQLQKYLTTGGTFSTQNPGLPVSYTVRDVEHRTIVKVNLAGQYDLTTCNPIVGSARYLLSLDASHATYDANGNMTAWPGDTTSPNAPKSVTNITRANTTDGRTWAQFSSTSSAPGIDCGWAQAGTYTVISATKPNVNGNGGALISSQHLFEQLFGQNFYTGWSVGMGQNTESIWVQSQDGAGTTSWTNAFQGQGHVSSVQFITGNGTEQAWSNGNPLPELGNGAATPPTVENCSIGSAGPVAAGFDGQVGEIRAYAGTLSDPEREFVECQLSAKWGIPNGACTNGRPTNASY